MNRTKVGLDKRLSRKTAALSLWIQSQVLSNSAVSLFSRSAAQPLRGSAGIGETSRFAAQPFRGSAVSRVRPLFYSTTHRSKGGLEPTLSIWLGKPVWHVRGEVRFWRAGTGHVGRGGQYDVMESVSAKGGFEPTSNSLRSRLGAKFNLMDSAFVRLAKLYFRCFGIRF